LRILDLPFLARRPKARAGLYLSGSAVALAVQPQGVHHIRCAAVPVRSAVETAAAAHELGLRLGARGAEVAIVLAPEVYQLLVIEQPEVAANEVRDAVRWRIQEYIDFPAEDAAVEVFPFPESAGRGRIPMIFVAAMPRIRLEAAVATACAAGFSPTVIDIMELALRNVAMRAYPSPEHGIGLLRITTSSGLVNVTRGDELFLSRRISGVPEIIEGEAWDAFKDGLLLQVQRSIDYYESGLGQPAATALLIAATHGWQERIVEHLEAMLPLPVRPLSRVLVEELGVELFNPGPVHLDADALSDSDEQALAAALPAVGGLLRAMSEVGTPA
jgi:MSHA biogenesis protein MshI